jgi:AraC family transcriptional regulator of adaptative response/methylated-DNA-[protein]-cysteine methyltransferase
MREKTMEASSSGAEAAWKAVVTRDRSQDGAFVYAVRTTGVYCRPSCPSRRPRRENVTFHPTPEDAERAGYRACARCGPGSSPGRGEQAAERAARWLDAHPDARVTLEELARRAGVSPYHLQRTFRRIYGASPREYQDARRLRGLKDALRSGAPVGAATYAAGYGSSRGVYESVRSGLGMTPSAYRRGGRGERIRFGTLATALGRLLVGATERGVCAVSLADDDGALERELRAEFPEASIARDDRGVAAWLTAVARGLAGGPTPDVPLDLRGTAFQLGVWRALRGIPFGETRSYREVAAAAGRAGAARAVARACAANRVAVLVPCHRVVPAAGGTGGYRWGAERKRALLALEREAPGGAPRAVRCTAPSPPGSPRR